MTNRTRVALVITELEVGGAERCLVHLATGLDRRRFEPVVYALAPPPQHPRDGLVAQLERAAIPTRFLGMYAKRQLPIAVRRLRRAFAEQQPDVVQTFLFHANIVGSLAARTSPRPRVAFGVRVADPSGWRQRSERWFARRADRVVCVSRSVADYCAGRMRVDRQRLVVIPNGIDVDAYPAAKACDLAAWGVPAGRRAITCVGRLHRQKGIDWLLELAPDLLRRLGDCELLLVGDGPDRARLESIAASLQIGDRVHFVGWHPHVPGILAASAMLVLPSRWEGMPNVVLEAMATGLPVVSTRVAGVAELLGPQSDPQMAKVGDADGFARRVIALAEQPGTAEQIGCKNRQRARTHFSLGAMISAYQQLYESLTSGSG